MSVTSVSKSGQNHESSEDERGIITVRETWLVTVSSPLDDKAVVENAVDPITGEQIPAIFTQWTGYVSGVTDPDLRVKSRTPHQTDDIFVWTVTVEYTTEARNGIFDSRLQVYEWAGQTEKRALERDQNGVSIVNSAGNRYDPPIEEEESITIRRVTRNEEHFLDSTIKQYYGKVNSDTVTIGGIARDPYTVWMRDLKARREFAGSLEYDVVTYELHIKELNDTPANADQGGWYVRIADAGFQKHKRVDPADPDSDKVLDAFGAPLLDFITDPVRNLRLAQAAFLDGDGGELIHAITKMHASCSAISAAISVDETFPIVHNTGVDATNLAKQLHPLVTPFWIKVGSEIMRVNAYNIGTPDGLFSVTRGQKGTVATTHDVGDIVALQPIYFRFETKKKVPFGPLLLP